MKEDKLFVLTVSNETLKASPPALPHREGAEDGGCSKVSPKGGQRLSISACDNSRFISTKECREAIEGASIISHTWLVNTKRDKSIALKINAAILQQNNLRL